MLHSLLIIDSLIDNDSKSALQQMVSDQTMIHELDLGNVTFEEIKEEINSIYQENEVLGDTMELQHVAIMKVGIETTNLSTNYCSSELPNQSPIVVFDASGCADTAFSSHNAFLDLMQYCKDNFNLKSFDILDGNHMVYRNTWSNIIQHYNEVLNTVNDYMDLNTLKCNETFTYDDNVHWMRQLMTNDALIAENTDLISSYFVENVKSVMTDSANQNAFTLNASTTSFEFGYPDYTAIKSDVLNQESVHIMFVPIVQFVDNHITELHEVMHHISSTQNKMIFPIMIAPEDTNESLMVKMMRTKQKIINVCDLEQVTYSNVHLYLRPYWNNMGVESKRYVPLSNNIGNISVDINTDQSNNETHQPTAIDAILGTFGVFNDSPKSINFEIHNMSQNYENQVDTVFQYYSKLPAYQTNTKFVYNYVRDFDAHDDDIYAMYSDHVTKHVNTIIYTNGSKEYFYTDSAMNTLANLFEVSIPSLMIEVAKIHNVILYDRTLEHHIDDVYKSCTPNTIIIPFDPYDTTFDSLKQIMIDVMSNESVQLRNVSLFQESNLEDDIDYFMLHEETSVLSKVKNEDATLDTWSKFKAFACFLDQHGVKHFDLLMCKIYSNDNWKYVISEISSTFVNGMTIRSSDDNTGHVMFDGDWVLESPSVDVNLIPLYFNETILDVQLVLGGSTGEQTPIITKDGKTLYIAGYARRMTTYPPEPTLSRSVSRYSSDYYEKYELSKGFYGDNDSLNVYEILDPDEKIIQIATNPVMIFLLTNKNKVYSMGQNDNGGSGALGRGIPRANNTDTHRPGLIQFYNEPSDLLDNHKVVMITSGGSGTSAAGCTFLLLDDGSLFGCGQTHRYLLAGQSVYNVGTYVTEFIRLDYSSAWEEGEIPIKIVCGAQHFMALTNRNKVYSIGRDVKGVTAQGVESNSTHTTWLTQVKFDANNPLDSDEHIVNIFASSFSTVILSNKNKIYVSGNNGNGRIGLGSSGSSKFFKLIDPSYFNNETIIRVFVFGILTWVVTENGFYRTGNQIMNLLESNITTFTQYDFSTHSIPDPLFYCQNSTIMENGDVYSWGHNLKGRMGTHNAHDFSTTTPIIAYNGPTNSTENEFRSIGGIGSWSHESVSVAELNTLYSAKSNEPMPSSCFFSLSTENKLMALRSTDSTASIINIEEEVLLTNGTYIIYGIPAETPIAVLNYTESSNVSYTGSSLVSSSTAPDGNTYNFYSGTLYIVITSRFSTPISLYTTGLEGSYMGTENKFVYSDLITFNNVRPLHQISKVNVVQDSGSNKYVFNDHSTYISTLVYGVNVGTYVFTNVPEDHAFAVLNKNFESEIEYYGTSSKGTHQAPDGNDYEFFYGTVTMTIKSNAQNVLDNSFSIACHQHGYMGAENVIRVIDDAQYTVMKTDISYNTYTHDAGNVAIDTNKYYVECVDKNSQVNVIDDTTHGKVLLLNNDTTYESDKIYAIYNGVYKISGFADNNDAIALHNKDVSNAITITGTTSAGVKTSVYDSESSYEFFSGTVTLTISGQFDDVVILERYGATSSDTAPLKLMYSSVCEPTMYGLTEVPSDDTQTGGETGDGETGGETGDGGTGGDTGGDTGEVVENKECLTTVSDVAVVYDSNNEEKYLFNYTSGKEHNSEKTFGVNVGSYLLRNVPDTHPIGFTNGDMSNYVEYEGNVIKTTKLNALDGEKYNLYSGDVKLYVKSIPPHKDFIPFITSVFIDVEQSNVLKFDESCPSDGYYYKCLKASSTIELSGNVVKVNDEAFSGVKRIGVYTGHYKFVNVPKSTPISFKSANNSDKFTMTGFEQNKEQVTVSDVSYDFYHGDVFLNVTADISNDLVLMIKKPDTQEVVESVMTYTDFCIETPSTTSLQPTDTECLQYDNALNFVTVDGMTRILMNNDTSYNALKNYGLNVGLYAFKNVSIDDALRIDYSYNSIDPSICYITSFDPSQNDDYDPNYADEDDVVQYNTVYYTKNNVSNEYYYGNVYLHIKSSIGNNSIKFDFANVSNMKSNDVLFFTDTCQTSESYYYKCLDISSQVTHDANVSNNVLFNNETDYNEYRKYGIHVGNYAIHGVTSTYPLAVLNNDISDIVQYSGSNVEGTKDISGVTYTFYSGTLNLVVKEDFTSRQSHLSVHSLNNGSLGGDNAFVFKDTCEVVGPNYYIDCLQTSQTFTLSNDGKLILNGQSEYDADQRFGLFIGTYTITNIPETHPIALVSSAGDVSNKIKYSGSNLYNTKTVDGNSVKYYTGTMYIYVMEPFDVSEFNLSIEAFDENQDLGMQYRLMYHEYCGSFDNLDYTICTDSASKVNIFENRYTFNNATGYFSYKTFGFNVGTYKITNVPLSNPIALLNNGKESNITYSGDDSKKVTGNDPNGIEYDFYYGDITVNVFGDFGTCSVHDINGVMTDGVDIFKFATECESNGKVTQCLTATSQLNIIGNEFALNGDTVVNNAKVFGLSLGNYKITGIPSTHYIAVLQQDVSDSVEYFGESGDLCGNFVASDGNTYAFYTNQINITVKKSFDTPISLYSLNDNSYLNGEGLLVFSDVCEVINQSQTYTSCLDSDRTLMVQPAQDDVNRILLDASLNTYDANRKYGMYLGSYTLDVSESNPIALFNTGKEHLIQYQGSSQKVVRKTSPDGNAIYNYYHGQVIVNVLGDFGTLDFHILNQGYMGGLKAIRYTDFCDLGENPTIIECLNQSSKMNVVTSNSEPVYEFNDNTFYSTVKSYGVHIGNYQLTDISQTHPIAFMNNGIEDSFSYYSSSENVVGTYTAPDGNDYVFYKNTIDITVNGTFDNVSMLSLKNGNIVDYLGNQSRIKFTDVCESTSDTSSSTTSNDVTTDFYKLKLSEYEVHGDDSYF